MLKTSETITARPTDRLSFDIEHVMKKISVPNGDVTVHIGMFDASFNFTPDMYVRTQVQYDNISKNFELSLRYRWEFEPGAELLVVLGEDALMSDTYYRSNASTFSIRLGKTFRL